MSKAPVYLVMDNDHDSPGFGGTADKAEAEQFVKVWNDLVAEELARIPKALPYWCKPEKIHFYQAQPLPPDPVQLAMAEIKGRRDAAVRWYESHPGWSRE